MATVLDDAVLQGLNSGMAKEAVAASDSRTRAWDGIFIGIGTTQLNYLNAPSVLASQGIRMLNGTPGPAPQPWGSNTPAAPAPQAST